jgi:hypothetical protein
MMGVDATALAAAAQARLDGSTGQRIAVTEEEFRWQEYDVLCNAATDPADELFVERRSGKDYGWLGNYVRQVGLVRKLRETRVLTGFSRLMPKSDLSDPAVQRLSIDQTLPWLPAIDVRGEPTLRMLQVPELKRAMGLTHLKDHRGEGVKFELENGTRRDKIKVLGNGV